MARTTQEQFYTSRSSFFLILVVGILLLVFTSTVLAVCVNGEVDCSDTNTKIICVNGNWKSTSCGSGMVCQGGDCVSAPSNPPNSNPPGSNQSDYLTDALSQLCASIQNLIPTIAMLLIIVSGVAYAAGQVFGSEMRARATLWATACLTGAIIGIIIAQVAPQMLAILAGPGVVFTCG